MSSSVRHSDSADDDALDVVRRRGYEHEQRYLDSLRAEDRWIVEIPESRGVERRCDTPPTLTRDAIAEGVDVIFQATFFDESGPLSWRGHADFLERVPDVKSDSGSFVYEPVDTKLAHSVKPGAVLQLCQYASQLTEIQQYEPRLLHIELGDGERASFRYASVAAYFRLARRRFETAILAGHGDDDLSRAGGALLGLHVGGAVRPAPPRRRPPLVRSPTSDATTSASSSPPASRPWPSSPAPRSRRCRTSATRSSNASTARPDSRSSPARHLPVRRRSS